MAALPVLTINQEFIAVANIENVFDGATAPANVAAATSITASLESVDTAAQLITPVAQSISDTDPVAGAADWSAGRVLIRIPAAATAALSEQLCYLTIQADSVEYKIGGSLWIKK